MKLSAVIACYDEGPDLEATVALLLASEPAPHQVIVVDDGCTQPLEERLAWAPVEVHRTPQRVGAGPAKNFGANLATGDAIVILDSHMRVGKTFAKDVLDAVKLYPRTLMCSVSQGFGQKGAFEGAGCAIVRGGDSFALGRRWLRPRDRHVASLVPCVFGACYFMSQGLWVELAGLNPNFHGWGYEEQDLSFRAWLSGRDVRCVNSLIVQHNYARNLDHRGKAMNTWESRYNALVCTATLFEDGVFERLYEPFLRKLAPGPASELFDETRDEIGAFRDWVQSKRKVRDRDLDALMAFSLPTVEQQLEDLDLFLRASAKGAA